MQVLVCRYCRAVSVAVVDSVVVAAVADDV